MPFFSTALHRYTGSYIRFDNCRFIIYIKNKLQGTPKMDYLQSRNTETEQDNGK